MKKIILLTLSLILASLILVSCGGDGGEEETTQKEVKTEQQTVVETTVPDTVPDSNTTASQQTYDPADYKFVRKFDPPTGDYRQIVKDYMLKQANIEWTPTHDIHVTWKKQGDFGVDMLYKKGAKYKGIIYAGTNGDYGTFAEYVNNGILDYNGSEFFEEVVGNHCSSSMIMAYQQLLNFPMNGTLKPTKMRRGMIKFVGDLEMPDEKEWYSETLFAKNSQQKVYEAYAQMKTGDILYKNIKGSGHTRMVDYVELKKTLAGQINYGNSIVYTIEQTNCFESSINKDFATKNGYDTTWWIDHEYTFKKLYDTLFMPTTLSIFESGEKLQDAYICYNGNVSPETIVNGIDGKIISNFPINYVRMSVKDANGNVVSDVLRNKITQDYAAEYTVSLRYDHAELMDKVPAGTYTFTLRAGIARGSCEICNFTFTK